MTRLLRCPACDVAVNMNGIPFASEWAVALHVAGAMHSVRGNSKHRAWARRNAPAVDPHERGWALARQLEPAVHRALKNTENKPSHGVSNVEVILQIERQLHSHIEQRLQQAYPGNHEEWWVEGVPPDIRRGCAQRREDDPDRGQLFSYTLLIDLKTILDKRWALFELDLARVEGAFASKKQFLDGLTGLNLIRNRYLHGPRAPETDSTEYRRDQSFLCAFGDAVSAFGNFAQKGR